MRKSPTSARARVLALLEDDPTVEWTATEVAERLDVPVGTAGGSLFKNWDDHHLARRKVKGLFRYRALNGLDAGPPAPRPAPATPEPARAPGPARTDALARAAAHEDTLTRIAALWTALGLSDWSPAQVALALTVADHVRERAAEGGIAPEPSLWFTGYTGRADQPPATKERDHE